MSWGEVRSACPVRSGVHGLSKAIQQPRSDFGSSSHASLLNQSAISFSNATFDSWILGLVCSLRTEWLLTRSVVAS